MEKQKELLLKQEDILIGVKCGFYMMENNLHVVYVSPALYKLLKDDWEGISPKIVCFRMPKDDNGKDKFNNLNDWLQSVIDSGTDIFCGSKSV